MPQGQPTGVSLGRTVESRHPASTFIFISSDPGVATRKKFAVRAVFGKPLDFAALRRAVADQSEAG
jgi:hypothetical protein